MAGALESDLETGLALSGGGFRATLFNLGGLWRLNDLGWLPKLSIVTSVSGGSITSGVLAKAWASLTWTPVAQGKSAENFGKLVVDPVRNICRQSIDVGAGLEGIFSLTETIAERVADHYDALYFKGARLGDIPDAKVGDVPRFIFYATSLQTGASVRISKKYLADYRVGVLDTPDLTLARVVGASSAFPPVLSPVIFTFDPSKWRQVEGANLFGDVSYRQRLVLTDGGVYDNMGTEAIWRRCITVLVSDAGAPFEFSASPSKDWTGQLKRVLDIVTEQTRALRKRKLIDDLRAGARKGTYWGITTQIANYGLTDTLLKDTPATQDLKNVRTRLNPFSDEEQKALINWGYALADAALRRHVLPPNEPLGNLPY